MPNSIASSFLLLPLSITIDTYKELHYCIKSLVDLHGDVDIMIKVLKLTISMHQPKVNISLSSSSVSNLSPTR